MPGVRNVLTNSTARSFIATDIVRLGILPRSAVVVGNAGCASWAPPFGSAGCCRFFVAIGKQRNMLCRSFSLREKGLSHPFRLQDQSRADEGTFVQIALHEPPGLRITAGNIPVRNPVHAASPSGPIHPSTCGCCVGSADTDPVRSRLGRTDTCRRPRRWIVARGRASCGWCRERVVRGRRFGWRMGRQAGVLHARLVLHGGGPVPGTPPTASASVAALCARFCAEDCLVREPVRRRDRN